MQEKVGFLDLILLYGGIVLTWLTGEGGRVAVAAGMGGMVRWLASERRRIRDGVIAVVAGFFVGQYMWPGVLSLPTFLGRDPFGHTPDNIAMAAFVAGTMGMSLVKIMIAFLEVRGRRFINGGDDE